MKTTAIAFVLLLIGPAVAGCFGDNSPESVKEESVFDDLCEMGIVQTTWYHFANATDATNISTVINGDRKSVV